MFFFWVIFLIIFIIIMVNATIQLQIQNFKFSTDKNEKEYFKGKYTIKIRIYILKKIKLWEFKINKSKIEKLKLKRNIIKIEKKLKNNTNNIKINKKVIEIIKKTNLEIKNFNLKIYIGLINYEITAISIGVISTLISIILREKMQEKKEIWWKVIPLYNNKNLIKIDFNCIFCIKLIHIIYTICTICKEGERKNAKSSNRGNYAYNHE